MFSSSSTTRTRREGIVLHSRQQDTESCSAKFTIDQQNVPTDQQCAALRDGESKSHTGLFERYRRLEQRGPRLFTQAGTGIMNLDSNMAVLFPRPAANGS